MLYSSNILFSDRQKAITLIVIAFLFLPSLDAIAKLLSADISAGQIAWTRFGCQALIMAPFFIRSLHDHKIRYLFPQAMRGILIASTTVLIFSAVKLMPLAEVMAIFFIEPLIVTLLSAIFLGEKIGWRRVSATLIGFSGALIVVRPSYEVFGFAAILPFGAAIFFAIYIILTRKLSQTENPNVMQFSSGVSGLFFISLALILGYFFEFPLLEITSPSSNQWILLGVLGIIATIGHLMITYAIKHIEASTLAPFQYLEIVGATIFGLCLFNDFPDILSWFGIFIIIGSGIYVFNRERITKTNRF